MTNNIVGMAWYKPENFRQLRDMFEDGNLLQADYAAWRSNAELACMQNQAKGVKVVKVDIDPVDFPRWCQQKGLHLNAQGRLAYLQFVAEQVIRQRDQQTKEPGTEK